MSDVDKKLESLEKSINEIKSSREWRIAVVSAVFAAFASLSAALLGYLGHIRSIEVDKTLGELNAEVTQELGTLARKIETQRLEIEENKVALDVYKHFGTIIAAGEDPDQCNAIVLMSALGGKFFADVEVELATNFHCGEKTEAALQNVIETRAPRRRSFICEGGRATRTTIKNLHDASEANQFCSRLTTIPEEYLGPWSDGRVTFETSYFVEDQQVWCNCLPLPLPQE